MSQHAENSTTMYFADDAVNHLVISAEDMDWDEDTIYRFLRQVGNYCYSASEDYKPEWAR